MHNWRSRGGSYTSCTKAARRHEKGVPVCIETDTSLNVMPDPDFFDTFDIQVRVKCEFTCTSRGGFKILQATKSGGTKNSIATLKCSCTGRLSWRPK